MQGASACNVAWFGIPWDYELYDQFIRRIRRDGTLALQIFNHLLLVKCTIDELKLQALRGKDLTQSGLMRALNAEIRRDADTLAAGDHAANERSETMVAKLTRPGAATPAAQVAQEQTGAVQPKGWANRGAAAQTDVEDTAPATQRERIQEQINPEKAPARGAAFGRRVQEAAEAIQGTNENVQEHSNGVRTDQPDPVAVVRQPRTRGPAKMADPVPASERTNFDGLVIARAKVLAIAFADPAMELEDGLAVADELWKWASAVKA